MSPPPAPGPRATARQRPHVLVVTDDPGLKEFLAEGLVVGGFWLSTVGSAIQTLEVFRLRSFDLVLVDAALGGIGAVELVRRLRGRSDRAAGQAPRTDVPILFVAASTAEIDAERVQAVGADGILLAPLELADVIATLFAVIATWRAAHPDRPYADEVAQLRPQRPTP